MVLLRGDGTPTYMLSVVVDDHNMGITHVVRGDDHLTNAFRQVQLFKALGWTPPTFAHIPLIHGPTAPSCRSARRPGGSGLPQRHGYLPAALRNYLLRLGWSHGDEEIISTGQAVEWFDLDAVGRSPSRFDFDKLGNLNRPLHPRIRRLKPRRSGGGPASKPSGARLWTRLPRDAWKAGLAGLKPRAKTIVELAEIAAFYIANRPLTPNDKAAKLLTPEARQRLAQLRACLDALTDWSEEALEAAVRDFAEQEEVKLGQVAQPLRAALTGSNASPGLFRSDAGARTRRVVGAGSTTKRQVLPRLKFIFSQAVQIDHRRVWLYCALQPIGPWIRLAADRKRKLRWLRRNARG